MADVIISSAPTPLADGLLQIQNGVPIDGTLRTVTDQNNNASTLKLSTSSAQFVSPLRITTDDPSDFYLDCEDGSTNNRFSITRNTASQQVNLNFASNPAGSTTTVGAIRTYVDGVNLSEVMSFREDGNIGIGTTTPLGKLHVNGISFFYTGSSYTQIQGNLIYLNGGDGILSQNYLKSYVNGFSVGTIPAVSFNLLTSNTERLTIGGTGNVGIGQTSPTSKLHIVGTGSTSATTSLLVQNSAGTELFRVRDDGNFNLALGTLNWGAIGFGSYIASDGYDMVYNTRQDSKVHLFNVGGNRVLQITRLSATDYRVSIGFNSGNEASAILELKSTTQGFLPPRLTTIEKNAIVTPAIGLMVFDTTLGRPCFYNGAWITL